MDNNDKVLDRLECNRRLCKDDSISDYLLRRSLGLGEQRNARVQARRQYVNVCPTATLYEQEMPSFLRRFSPSGKVSHPRKHKCHPFVVFDWIWTKQSFLGHL